MKFPILSLTSLLFAGATAAHAAVIVPTYDTFGTLAGATFGGTGIPNDAVAIDTTSNSGNTITLGLTATQRFNNPALNNNGAGTFYATPGANYGTPATPNTPGTPSYGFGATWNLGWYIGVAPGTTAEAISAAVGYTYELYYDLNPAAGTPVSGHGILTSLGLFSPLLASVSVLPPTAQSSQNMNFGFWTVPISGVVNPPGGTFDPNAPGEYTFSLRAYNAAGSQIGESAIAVVVVPEPSTYLAGALLALPFGFGYLRRRFSTR